MEPRKRIRNVAAKGFIDLPFSPGMVQCSTLRARLPGGLPGIADDQIAPSPHCPRFHAFRKMKTRAIIGEMMKCERTKHKVGRNRLLELEDIGGNERYLRVRSGPLRGQFQSCPLKINGGNLYFDIMSAAPIDREPGDISKPRTQIDDANGCAGPKPAPEEISYEGVTAEKPV